MVTQTLELCFVTLSFICDKNNNRNSWFPPPQLQLWHRMVIRTLPSISFCHKRLRVIAITIKIIVIVYKYTCYNNHKVNTCAINLPNRSIWPDSGEYKSAVYWFAFWDKKRWHMTAWICISSHFPHVFPRLQRQTLYLL